MKIRLGELRANIRRLLEFGVDDTLRHEAGFFMDGGNAGNTAGNPVTPPPGLGSEDNEDEVGDTDGKAQEKSQPAARVADRYPGARRSFGTARDR